MSLFRVSAWPAPGLFAYRARRNEGVYVDTQLSEDAARWANSPGPKGCHGAFTRRQRAAWLAGQASAAPRTTTWRTHCDNAGYAETLNRLQGER